MIDLLSFGGNIITVMLGSGAAFGFMNLYSDRKKHKNNAEFLATQIAVQLEGYAIECADKISEHTTAEDSDNHAGRLIGKIPEYPPLPTSDSYNLLNRGIVDEVLQFPQERQMADKAAYFWWDVVGDPECCNAAYKDNTIRMGERAARLAKKIRNFYKLPERKLVFGEWDIYKFFNDELAAIIERERKQAMTMEKV